ncbi:MAG: twin-arginine translocation signal domain-containing protein, partial [Actinobacteria bacterium]|nr:twin-arginine translocation signal domain-containing protein [Actinomycetota bacterium]
MDTLTRRKFLQLSGAATVGAVAPMLTLDEIAAAASTRPLPLGTPILIMVTLYGGNDGLNTVVPYTDPIYFSSRPDISYAPEKVLKLDEQLGLNPAMTGIKSMWDQKKVAIVRGVGYPKPDRSHFTSMAIW